MFRTNFFFFIGILFSYTVATAQNTETDSLKKLLPVTNDDSKRVSVLESLSYAYLSSYPDTALEYALQGLQLAQKIKFTKGEAICINAIGNVYFHTGDNAKALEMYLRYLQLKERLKDFDNLAVAYFNIGNAYTESGDYRHALFYIFKAKAEDERSKDSAAILYDLYAIGSTYLRMQKTDSALYFTDRSYQLAKYLDDKNMLGAVLNTFGETYLTLNDTAQAEKYYNLSIPHAEAVNDFEVLTSNYFGLAKIYKQSGMIDSSVYYACKAFYIANNAPFFKLALESGTFISGLFKIKNEYDSAFRYLELSMAIKDSLFNAEHLKKIQELKFQEQQRQQSIETEKIKYDSKIKLFAVVSVSVIFLVIALLLWRTNKHKNKANILLTEQKEKVESTLSELESTQARLIQSAKLASLGELTAGIAHEIQNPLNFVHNFSEVNNELIAELIDEVDNGDKEEVKLIAESIKQNSEKINHHSKRADSIVKNMLQHSLAGNDKKQLTDINVLAEEYLRLSYHGWRAKDKSFTAEIKTDFDENIGKINIIPQDIGRVLLNLFNNAFYAVYEKKKSLDGHKTESEYKPVVSVATRIISSPPAGGSGGLEIIVTDNGSGIPQNNMDKIFQPFFTTKPTGQGIGLGLSLAYEIIKTHGGEIKVKSIEDKGSGFIIQLPI